MSDVHAVGVARHDPAARPDPPAPSTWPLVATGALCGLAWGAALHGWTVQVADDGSDRWLTMFGLVVLPAAVVGALTGHAEHRRRAGSPSSPWLAAAPCLVLLALADPATRDALGAVRSVLTALDEPRGAWLGAYGLSLLGLLCLAPLVPQRRAGAALLPSRSLAAAVGALCGLAWACALRGLMSEVAGDSSTVAWAGTFLWVLLPGLLVGAVLGWTEHRRRSGPVPHRGWVVWSPMLFAAVLLRDPRQLVGGDEGALGLAALAVPAICMVGGYGLGGRGPAWLRAVGVLVLAACVPAWALTAVDVGGESMALDSAHGAWVAASYWSLLATLALAASIPHRAARGATP